MFHINMALITEVSFICNTYLQCVVDNVKILGSSQLKEYLRHAQIHSASVYHVKIKSSAWYIIYFLKRNI